jgi:hypothetical protein
VHNFNLQDKTTSTVEVTTNFAKSLTMLGHPFCPLVNVCAFLNKPRLISLTLQIGSNFDLCKLTDSKLTDT